MHHSLGEDKSQLVVPQEYREEVTALAHRARRCVTLEAEVALNLAGFLLAWVSQRCQSILTNL